MTNKTRADADTSPTATLPDIEAPTAIAWSELGESVFVRTHDSIIVTDPHGTILDVNAAFTETTGYSRAEVVGRNPRLLKSGLHTAEFYADLWKSLRESGVWRGEILNRRKDGTIVAERLTISAVQAAEGRLSHYVCIFTDIGALKDKRALPGRLAGLDPLTGLPNRVLLAELLKQALSAAERSGSDVAICCLGLDGFKAINDDHGYAVGDAVLIETARRLMLEVGSVNVVGRFGSDEFVLLLTDPDAVRRVRTVLEHLRGRIAEPVTSGELKVSLSASVGVALYPADSADSEVLLRQAERAMRGAKNARYAACLTSDPVSEATLLKPRLLLAEVSQGLDRNEFCLHFQPRITLRDQKPAGFEALLRWQHPVRGLLRPDAFRAALDDPFLAAKIDLLVLREALEQLSRWQDAGLRTSVSVNTSTYLLRQPSFQPALAALLGEFPNLSAEDLELEIVETALIDDLPRVSRQIEACRLKGVRFAIDDFGTGYSSLTYLRHLPVDILKIDRSFVSGMVANQEDLLIVKSILALAKAFNRCVVAEGVESRAHLRLLRRLGCDMAQGSHIAQPMPAEAAGQWVADFTQRAPRPRRRKAGSASKHTAISE